MAVHLSFAFGFHCNIKNGIAFLDKNTVLFLAGEMCVLHNVEYDEQKFLPFPELDSPTAMAQGPHNIFAVANKLPTPRVIIYDTEHAARKITLQIPVPNSECVWLCFSSDFKYLAAQCSHPNLALIVWNWQKQILKTTYFPTSLKSDADIYQASFNPNDFNQVVAVGNEYLRVYRCEEDDVFKPHVFSRSEEHTKFLCVEWLSPYNWTAVGTSDGLILFFENGEQKYEIQVTDESLRKRNKHKAGGDEPEVVIAGLPISGLVATSKGFLCIFGHATVIEYLRTEDEEHYEYSISIHLPHEDAEAKTEIGEIDIKDIEIKCLKVSPSEELVVVFTNVGQIFIYSLASHHICKGTLQNFSPLTQPVHRNTIVGMDVAVTQPLIVTCSSSSIIIWNYMKRISLMRKCFSNEILSICIHPLGLYLVIGFKDCAIVSIILNNSLLPMNQIQTENCTEVSFAPGGHILAIVNNKGIHIYDFITMGKICELSKHIGSVNGMTWSECSTFLTTCDDSGMICKWNVVEKEIVGDSISVPVGILGICSSPDGVMYFSTEDNRLQIIRDSNCQKFKTGLKITQLCLSSSGSMLFGGLENGTVKVWSLPIVKILQCTEKAGHMSKITKLKLTLNCQYLISAGVDGMLCIWEVTDKEKFSKHSVQFSPAVLIDQAELIRHHKHLKELKESLTVIQKGYDEQLKAKDDFHEYQIKAAYTNLEQKIDNLTSVIKHIAQENAIIRKENEGKQIQYRGKGSADCDFLEQRTVAKILKEYSRYDKMRLDHDVLEKSLVKKMHDLQVKNKDAINVLVKSYEGKIAEKEALILQGKKLIEEKEKEYDTLCHHLLRESETEAENVRASVAREIQMKKTEIEQLKEVEEIARKKSLHERKYIIDLKGQLEIRINEGKSLESIIWNLEEKISETQEHISIRTCTIEQLNDEIINLQEKYKDLEQHDFVLFSATQNLTEQRSFERGLTDIEASAINELNHQLRRGFDTDRNMKQELEMVSTRLRSIQKELQNEKKKVNLLEDLFESYKNDLLNCNSLMNEPQKLKLKVRKMLDAHCDKPKFSKEEGALSNDQIVFPREHLEKTLHLLRRQIGNENYLHSLRCARMCQEKDHNQRSINQLKEDLKLAHIRCKEIESAFGMTYQEISSDAMAVRQKMEDVYGAVYDDEMKKQQEQKRKKDIIAKQSQKIINIRAKMYGYEAVK